MSELERHQQAAQVPRIPAFVTKARNAISVKRVFGKPIERDGVIVIPAAHISGGGGGGGGIQPGNIGSGGGFGVRSRPAGALVVRDGDVEWVPARDPERRLAIYATLTALGLLTLRTLLPRHRRRRR
ncbi:MAG TPA: spore germination protein GerW family protein [Acidimicrobiia bacterium]|jgi:uncharacterized spore protein YtfJ